MTVSFSSFSQNESKFKKSLRYQIDASPEVVLSDMAILKKFDDEQEGKCRFWHIVCVVGIAAIVIGVICLYNEYNVAAAYVGISGAVLAIVGKLFEMMNSRLDLDNRRYEFVAGLLELLSKDMAADSSTTIDLDFQPHNHKHKLDRTGMVSYWNVKFYVDRWLSMRGRFLDGTKYSVTVLEKQQDRHRKKRSASGKTKHKNKTKNASEIIVSLKFKNKRYPQAQELFKKIKQTVQLPPWVELKAVETVDGALTIRSATKLEWGVGGSPSHDGVNWAAMMFLSLYKLLNDAK